MANKSISQLTAGSAVSGTDLFPDVQTAGVGPVKVTATQLATYFWNSPTLVTPSLGAATATSINIGGATLGSNVLAVNGTAIMTSLALGGATIGSNNLAVTGTTALAGATTVSTGGLTIGVAGTTGGTIALKGSTAGTLTLQVPATVTDYSITLPSAVAAANGYILTSTTAGVTSWTNPTALGVDLDVGTTAITNGTVGRVLFEGTGNVLQESANLTFSTAALTLGVQQTTQGSLILANTAAGAFSTTLQASNSASAAWTLTLPISAGTNNYVLTTNGSGVSSWAQVSLTAGVTGTLPVANGGTGTATAFTAGSVVFAGASGVYSQDNANFFWDDTNNRLGIGTATPSQFIHLYNASNDVRALIEVASTSKSPQLQLKNAAGETHTIGSETSSGNAAFGGSTAYGLEIFAGGTTRPIQFGVNSNVAMTLDAVGNLLLGGTAVRATTAGTAHLDIFNGTAPAGTLTNGISLYSSSGDFHFMDATGAAYKVGYRNIPQVTKTASYTPTDTSDVGKHISITTGGVTVNASVFSAGDVFTIYNNSGSSQNITAGSGVTFRLAGTATSGTPRTVAQYGLATVLCVTGGASPVFVLSGAGVA